MSTRKSENRKLDKKQVNRHGTRKALAPAERRDTAFGVPCRLWELVAWLVSTSPGCGQIHKLDEGWTVFVNASAVAVPIEPDGNPHGMKCGPAEAIAFYEVSGWGTTPVLRIRRNSVWSLADGIALEASLIALLEAELRRRRVARAHVKRSLAT